MKKKFLSLLIAACLVLPCCLGFVSCNDEEEKTTESTSQVTTEGSEKEITTTEDSDDGEQTTEEATTDGSDDGEQTTEEATTDGSDDEEQTTEGGAIENQPNEDGEPSYLGILVSESQPSRQDGIPEGISQSVALYTVSPMNSAYRSFDEALDSYFENDAPDTALPESSSYDIYSAAGETVYVQIWLNNPEQYTILSLKLNGTKYQIGGDLFSFFIEQGDAVYNCLYAAVTIPNGSYADKSYTVSDIEYIANTFINADGTDEFMNDNDTVSIGLPYDADMPAVFDYSEGDVTVNGFSASFSLSDTDMSELCGGLIGVAIYDGYDVVYNDFIETGNNTLNISGLVENTYYYVYVYIYGDLHDGEGACAHIFHSEWLRTSAALTVNTLEGVLLYDSENDGYYSAVNINTTLVSASAEYIKLEILEEINYDEYEVIYTDDSFDGSATVSEGILCGKSYIVRVYYKDTEYPEGKYTEESTRTNSLGSPWYHEDGTYTFVNDAVYYFQIGNNDENYPAIDSLVLKLYSEESARWFAEDVLYILDNPTAIDDLQEQENALWDEFYDLPRGDEQNELYNRIQELSAERNRLEDAKWYLENRADNNTDRAYWESEAENGKYLYEFEYDGTDTDGIFKVGKTYYAVLDGALALGYNSLKAQIDYKYDNKNGEDIVEAEISEQVYLRRTLTDHWVMTEDISYADGNLTLTLYNEEDWETNIRPPYAIGYVYKVMVNGETLYIDESERSANIDEEAWFEDYIECVKAGEDTDGLMDEYVSDYESSYTIPLDTSKLGSGHLNFEIYIRLVDTEYEVDEYHACRGDYLEIYAKLPTPVIEFNSIGEVIFEAENWWGELIYEAVDKNGQPVDIVSEGDASFSLPAAGTKVRVKLGAQDYWLESEWSEWYVFDGVKLATPTFGEYSLEDCSVSWSSDTEGVDHYVYKINDGEEFTVAVGGDTSVILEDGDVLSVKSAAADESVYVDSDWTTFTCEDDRVSLATPQNLRFENGYLYWDESDEGSYDFYYVVETNTGYKVMTNVAYSGMLVGKSGMSYRVRAMTDNTETYRNSAWSTSITYTA